MQLDSDYDVPRRIVPYDWVDVDGVTYPEAGNLECPGKTIRHFFSTVSVSFWVKGECG